MTPEAAVALLIAEARRYLPVRETPIGSNRGLAIDYWLTEAGVALALPWCAAFVGQMGRQALGAAWPCPRTASVAALAAWAETAKVSLTDPLPGDLFLIWFPSLKRFAHVGIVTAAVPASRATKLVIKTIEGNANPSGGREGFGVFEESRTPDPLTRYVRWTRML